MTRRVKNGLDQGAERAVIGGWLSVACLRDTGPGLGHTFISNLENGMEYPSRFSGDTRLWEACTMESRAAIQKYLNKTKKWTDRNLMEYNRGKCKVLQTG